MLPARRGVPVGSASTRGWFLAPVGVLASEAPLHCIVSVTV